MKIDLTDMLYALSMALDEAEHQLIGVATEHGKRVAYLSLLMAKAEGITGEELVDFAGCAILHDNALTEFIREELDNNYDIRAQEGTAFMKNRGHCVRGEANVRLIPFRTDVSNIILYHHENADGSGPFEKRAADGEVPLKAQILHLADMLDMSCHVSELSEEAFGRVQNWIESSVGTLFTEKSAELFCRAVDYGVVRKMQERGVEHCLREELPEQPEDYTDEEIHRIAEMFAGIVDYKSSFTKSHSIGVAEKALIMADYYRYPPEKTTRYYFAAAFHDIGKLVVDNDILEKPGKLDEREFREMKNHALATCRILHRIKGMEDIVKWAGHHHEKLDGSGYPFGLRAGNLSQEERLMACVDIYQALVEDRPYKEGLGHEKSIQIMENMAAMGKIDADIVRDVDNVFQKKTAS